MATETNQTGSNDSVNYRRPGIAGLVPARTWRVRALLVRKSRQLAPTLWPLLVGFALLLLVVFLLGFLSERELDSVERGVSDLQRQQSNHAKFYSELSAATMLLDNEARVRDEGKRAGNLLPPFEVRLNNARNQVLELLKQTQRPPYQQLAPWIVLQQDLNKFIATTRDWTSYNQSGFTEFRKLKLDLEAVDTDLQRELQTRLREGEELRLRATRRVRLLWINALLLGCLVIAGTIGEVQRRFGQMRDSMEATRRERRFSSQMLEGMVSAVVAINPDKRILSANAAFIELFPDAMPGAEVDTELAAGESLQMLNAALQHPVAEPAYCGRHVLAGPTNHPGTNRSFDIYSSPLEIDGETGRILTLVDVSEAARSEIEVRHSAALAAVGQASAQLAHEIKNPLGSIRLGVSMLREMTSDSDARLTIDLVDRGIEHLHKLVVDVTQFSRQRPLTISEVELNDVLDISLSLVMDRILEKQTPIVRNFYPDMLWGDWDEDQLRQVFVNLIANAIDASPEESPVSITTSIVEIDADHGLQMRTMARVEISDSGCGMDEETRARVFEPFYSTKPRGTGLGLAVVKQIVEQHNGVVSLSSTPGTGTQFIIDLPLKLDHVEI